MKVNVKLKLPPLRSIMNEAVQEVMAELAEEALFIAAEEWTGFEYKGNYSAEQQGTSGASWATSQLVDAGGQYRRGFTMYNDAKIKARTDKFQPKAWGRPYGEPRPYSNKNVGAFYAAYVHKAGVNVTPGSNEGRLWHVVFKRCENELQQEATTRLHNAVQDGIARGGGAVTELRSDNKEIGTYKFSFE